MLEFLSSLSLKEITYFVIGAVFGAILSALYSLSAHRPKLSINGGGGGGGSNKGQNWYITIFNRPSFFGYKVDGDSARDVHALIKQNAKKGSNYPLFWNQQLGKQGEQTISIEPGKGANLCLFQLQNDVKGYSIVDVSGEPIVKFQERELKFILTLYDSLNRKYKFKLVVEFDDTHLKQDPRLNIITPMTFSNRLDRIRAGLHILSQAFRIK